MSELYIGLMSGTSADSIDAGLVEFSNLQQQPKLIAFTSSPYTPRLQQRILTAAESENIRFDELLRLDMEVGKQFASAALTLMQSAGVTPDQITAIGSHGQTIHHSPQSHIRNTLQIGDPNTIAHLTGVAVVGDIRRRDMAAGGQGAPLASGFHAAMFSQPNSTIGVLNIGGIANLTRIGPGDTPVVGFDTGPGNGLMDGWIQRHQGIPFDRDGAWASSGTVCQNLLEAMLEDPYFTAPSPKSTGKEYFNQQWLNQMLSHAGDALDPNSVQTTLLHLTAETITQAVRQSTPKTERLWICGGGTKNGALMRQIQHRLPEIGVAPTDAAGIPAEAIEVMAFAWIGRQTLHGLPGNVPTVTGASVPCILGGIFSGKNKAAE